MFKRLNILIASSVIALALSNPVVADDTVEDFQTWGNITATGSFSSNPKIKWWLEGQGRFGNDSSRFSQGIIRPGIGYAINEKTTIWLGYAWIPTSFPFAGQSPFNEHRVWQQLLWSNPYSFGTITSRTRMEQRTFDIQGSTDVGHRFRQFLKWTVPMPAVSPKVSFVLLDEIFINLNNVDTGARSGFNQNRIFAGIAYKVSNIATAEIGYMNQYFNRPSSPRPDQMQHLLAINLFLNF